MSNPLDPYGQNPYSYDPLGRPPLEPPPLDAPPPPPPPRLRVNPLATLSLVFAFVFAPAGAVLGHLGLAEIRRTGELGRDRALVGIVLSYAFIASTVAALAAWAIFAALAPPPTRTAAPTSTAPTAEPGPPAVAPADVAALLPGLDALKGITNDQNLEAGPTRDRAGRSADDGSIDRPECWGAIGPGVPDAYTVDAILGYHAAKFEDTRTLFTSVEILQAVLAFRDAPTAQSQLAQVLSGWRHCGGKTVTVTFAEGGSDPFVLGVPADAGNGVTTLDLMPKGLQVRCVRAIAGKGNVVVDILVSSDGTTDATRARQTAVSIANYVLGKIPG